MLDVRRLLDQHACAVFEELSRTEQALDDYRRQRRTRLRVKYFSTAGRSFIVPAVAAITRAHPDVQVELRLQPDGDPSRRVLEACSAAGFTPQYRVECNDIDTAMGLVAAGLGIGVMPRLGLVHPHPDVAVRALRSPVPTRRVHVLHGSSLHESEAATAFVTDLRAASAVDARPGRPAVDSRSGRA